jgi:hypothetical protein
MMFDFETIRTIAEDRIREYREEARLSRLARDAAAQPTQSADAPSIGRTLALHPGHAQTRRVAEGRAPDAGDRTTAA